MAPPRPLVSVVTPTLNQAAFIAQTMGSVRCQDYTAVEYVIVDGGSTDGTLEILERAGGEPRWIAAPGEGQAAAVNRGWRATRGEIVAWLNSDDTYLPGAIGQAVEFFEAHPEVDVLYGDCDYVDAGGRFLASYPTRPHDLRRQVASAVSDIPQPAAFLRRRALDRVGYLDESLGYAMDLDLWLRMGAAGCTFQWLPSRLATLRLHAAAKSVRDLAAFAPELVRVYAGLFARPDLPPELRALQAEALSNVHYRASQCLFWSGRFADARRHAWRALRHSPLNLRRQLVLAAGGRLAHGALRSRWGNPFHLGLDL